MAKDVLHVVPHDQGWAVKREGNERASSSHPTQKDAIEAARELAKEQDDIVIHRPDGTIRERVTYSGAGDNGNGTRAAGDRRTEVRGTEVHEHDLASVGTRVRWGAVMAGVVVALALYIMLSLLAVAVGLSTVDHMRGRTFGVAAAVIAGVILLGAMFLGGFIASRYTVGEERAEGATYGILVWGATLLLLTLGGVGTGLGAVGATRDSGPYADRTVSAERMKQEYGWTDEQAQKYAAMTREARAAADQASPQAVAWWTFAGVALSLLAAIGGGLAGSGPEVATWRFRETRPVVVPRPA